MAQDGRNAIMVAQQKEMDDAMPAKALGRRHCASDGSRVEGCKVLYKFCSCLDFFQTTLSAPMRVFGRGLSYNNS